LISYNQDDKLFTKIEMNRGRGHDPSK